MIVGLGADLCEIERIAEALEAQGERFLRRICSERERAQATASLDGPAFYAERFAAKEACAKALGTGITERVRWVDIEVLASEGGPAALSLSGGALRRARRLCGGRTVQVDLSLGRDRGFATALVILHAP